MIIKLYKNNRHGFPLISLILLITCTVVTVPTAFQNELYHIFAMQSKPFFVWQTFSGIFEHSIYPTWFIWPHFLGNMSIAILFGVLIERLLGSNKMLLLTLLGAITNIIYFQIKHHGQYISGSGVSGIVYTYAPIALYILWKFIIGAKYNFKKDYLFYLLTFEFIFIWVFITAVSSWSGTNVYHVIATIVGLIFLKVCKRQINDEIDFVLSERCIIQKSPKSKVCYLTVMLPLFMITILFLYHNGNLNEMFIEPIRISSHDTIQDIINNNNRIEITFDKPITNFSSTSTSGFDTSKIIYSEDGKTIYCVFENGIHYPYNMKLSSAHSIEGHIVKDIVINIKE